MLGGSGQLSSCASVTSTRERQATIVEKKSERFNAFLHILSMALAHIVSDRILVGPSADHELACRAPPPVNKDMAKALWKKSF